MKNLSTEFNRISWFFSACIEQFRYVGNDNKRLLKVPAFAHSLAYNQYLKHFHMSLNLLKQGEKMWTNFLKSSRMQGQYVENLYTHYMKRSTFQFRLCLDDILHLTEEVPLGNDPLYIGIVKKTKNLFQLIQQLDQAIYHIIRAISL